MLISVPNVDPLKNNIWSINESYFLNKHTALILVPFYCKHKYVTMYIHKYVNMKHREPVDDQKSLKSHKFYDKLSSHTYLIASTWLLCYEISWIIFVNTPQCPVTVCSIVLHVSKTYNIWNCNVFT